MEDTGKKSEKVTSKMTNFFSLLLLNNEIKSLKSNMDPVVESASIKMLNQRQEKSTLFPGQSIVLSIDASDEISQRHGCYVYKVDCQKLEGADVTDVTEATTDKGQYVIFFVTDHEELLNLFRSDLDKYCLEIYRHLKDVEVASSETIPSTAVSLLENWYENSVGYLLRCIQALQDNIKFLIYSALLDSKLVTSGGTEDLRSDIQRFYSACSLSDILSQLKESGLQNQGIDSESSSIDMVVDADQAALETQGTVTVSITADSVKLDASGCNKFCEDWANALHRPDCQNNPARLKQIIEAFKLKFIQTMNTLKRILREAENDFYALYRSYVFLRDSGNSEILLHYVALESAADVKDVLQVLQDFIKEQNL